MIQTTQPSGDDLDSLFYEIWMMNQAYGGMSAASPGVTHNAFLECFLLHLRNLIYFLRDPQRPTDLTYKDFHDKNGQALSPTQHAITQEDVDAIHQHLQHITKVRTQKKINWPAEPLLLEINRAMSVFLDQIPDAAYFPTKEKRTREDFLRQLAARIAGTRMAYLPVGLQTSTTVETTTIIPAFPPKKEPSDAQQG